MTKKNNDYSDIFKKAAMDVANNGYRILSKPLYQKVIKKTIIMNYGNGLVKMTWLDGAEKIVAEYRGVLGGNGTVIIGEEIHTTYKDVKTKKYNEGMAMAKTYLHYGIDVKKQVIDKDFRQGLTDNGISYIDLPVMDVDVIKYVNNDITRYAVIQDRIVPGEFIQAVYITEQIPDDCDWPKLICDVEAQEQGEPAEQMRSKLKMVLDIAEGMVRDKQGFNPLTILDKPSIEDIGYALISLKYNKDKLSRMNAHDVDSEFLKDLLDWFD